MARTVRSLVSSLVFVALSTAGAIAVAQYPTQPQPQPGGTGAQPYPYPYGPYPSAQPTTTAAPTSTAPAPYPYPYPPSTQPPPQQPPPQQPPPQQPPPSTAGGMAGTNATTTTTTSTDKDKDKKEDDGVTDHEKVVHRIGVGYFGQFEMPLGSQGNPEPVQLIGVRYWMSEKIGLTLGLGLGVRGGSRTANNTTTDDAGVTAAGFKAGVPISPYYTKHFTFFFEPQALIGIASQTQKIPGTSNEISHSGHHIALGSSAGAELHFGFIGVPNLTLDATVGLAFDIRGGSTKTTTNGVVAEESFSQTSIATFSRHQPWSIFVSNVAAIYYF